MKKRNIAIDLDDVTSDFNTYFALWHNERFGTTITYRDIFTFNLPDVYGISRSVFNERAGEFLHNHQNSVALVEGAAAGLQQLVDWDFNPHVVTSRWDSLEAITWQYLTAHVEGLIADIHFANKHHEYQGTKVEICRYLNAVALFEDALRHAAPVAAIDIPVLLHDKPWNETSERIPAQIIRCGRWQEPASGWEDSTHWVGRNLL